MKSFIAIIVVFAIAIVAGLSSGYDSAEAQADAAVAVQAYDPTNGTAASKAPIDMTVTGGVLISRTVEFIPQPPTVTETTYCGVVHAKITEIHEYSQRLDLQR